MALAKEIEHEMFPGRRQCHRQKSRPGFFDRIPRELMLAYGREGRRIIQEAADERALVYAPYILAAVRDVGHSYTAVARWLCDNRIPSAQNGEWRAQTVKNIVLRYERLTGKRILYSCHYFPTPWPNKGAQSAPLPWEARQHGTLVRFKGFGPILRV